MNLRYPGSGSYRGGSGGFGSGGYRTKFGYNNRKISTDSGISAISSISTVSRSTVDTVDSEDREVGGVC